jgi:hypothetical protein
VGQKIRSEKGVHTEDEIGISDLGRGMHWKMRMTSILKNEDD